MQPGEVKMLSSLKKMIVVNFGFHFANIYETEDKEVNLFIRAFRGVSGVNLIYWQRDLGRVVVFVLRNTTVH